MRSHVRMKSDVLPSWRQPLGVRASLALLVLGSVLPLAGVAAFLIVDFYARERTQLINNSISKARLTVAAVDREFDGMQAALLALATSIQLRDGNLRGFHSRALDALGNLRAESIVIVDITGALLLSTRRPFGAPLPSLASTPLLQRVLETGKPGVSDLFIGPINKELIYTVAVPIRRDGAVVMTLNATVQPSSLDPMLAEQNLPKNWRAAIFDSRHQIVARSHEIRRFLGQQTAAGLRQRLARNGEGAFESRTLDGLPVFTVYSSSAKTHWAVAFGIPLDELTEGLRRSLAALILATLAAIVAGLSLAWRIGGGIAHSVRALIAPALAVASGNHLSIPPLAIKEGNELARALQAAATSVRIAHAEMREGEHRLALVADAARLGIWVRDLEKNEMWVSSQWRDLFGFGATGNITLDDLLERVHVDDKEAVERTLAQARDTASPYQFEYRIELPGGELRWIGSFGSGERDAADKPILLRGVSVDITKRKLAELDVQQKQKEVTLLSRVAVLGELSGAMAHELNQPLTAILSNAQAAQRFMRQAIPDLDEVRDILQDIVDEDQRAGEIISRLRRLFDHSEAQRQPVDVNELVVSVIRIIRNDLINHGVALATELAPAAIVISADRVQLQQVLINLLMNACDAMAERPHGERRIAIRTMLDADLQVQVSVVDCGPGILPAILDQIFSPFFTTKERGMGLGLSICRNIVSAHQGQLWAANNATGGATFHMRLPFASA